MVTSEVKRQRPPGARDLRAVRGEVNALEFVSLVSGGDWSAAINAALATGLPVYMPPGDYPANNLSQSTNYQAIRGAGANRTRLIKNANGPILTCAGDHVRLEGIGFRGDAASPTYTGDNLVITGNHPMLLDCGSRWAYGRALKATGSHVQVFGTGDLWQTADATATGYDIEIGISGTATLYHELHGIYTGQATGGLLFIDCGSQSVIGGEFGKLTVQSGTSPAGVNGGKYLGPRILGNISVGLSSAIFAGCQIGAVVVTFEAGTSGCRLDASNTFQVGATISNLGNASNNVIMREAGASGGQGIKFGDDAANVTMVADQSNGLFRFPKIRAGNNGGVVFRNAADSADAGSVNVDASDNMSVANTTSNKTLTLSTTGATSRLQFYVNAIARMMVDAAGIRVGSLGTAAPTIDAGTGDPEGVVARPVGSIWMRSDGGAGTSQYVKESGGTGNTGWVAK